MLSPTVALFAGPKPEPDGLGELIGAEFAGSIAPGEGSSGGPIACDVRRDGVVEEMCRDRGDGGTELRSGAMKRAFMKHTLL